MGDDVVDFFTLKKLVAEASFKQTRRKKGPLRQPSNSHNSKMCRVPIAEHHHG
jgi:hypothetical protein